MDMTSLLTYEESERDDRSRLTSRKRRGHGSSQVGARKMVRAPTWEVVSFVTNGCAAHHSGHVLTIESKSGSLFFRSFTSLVRAFFNKPQRLFKPLPSKVRFKQKYLVP